MTITLRPHQLAAADAIDDAYRAGITKPLVDACVASGKSLMMAETARRAISRGGRVIIGAHTRELVEQNAAACVAMGLEVGINAAALGQRTWRAPVISAAIQSIYKNAASFGPISDLLVDEAHLVPHSEAGMYRALHRALSYPRMPGFSGTVFRLNGGRLDEGDEPPFERVVYTYSILDGIRDGYLCPAFSLGGADDHIDLSKLRTRNGDFSGESSDAQMLGLIDNHITQMVHHGAERRAWLAFEASTKAAKAMAQRMTEWGIPTGLVLGETPAGERAALIDAFRTGRLRAMVNVAALTTGFDVPHVDLLVMRRPTKSLGLYIQMVGRALRCVGGNITASAAAGKAEAGVLDFAGNIELHGPLDFIRPKESKPRLVKCEECNTRNAAAAKRCWHCDALMMKLCPACLGELPKGTLDCTHCGFDMRTGPAAEKGARLLEVPSGAALISSWRAGSEKEGGWLPVLKVWSGGFVEVTDGSRYELTGTFAQRAPEARWLRVEAGQVAALLLRNGGAHNSARQLSADGSEIIVPMPANRTVQISVDSEPAAA